MKKRNIIKDEALIEALIKKSRYIKTQEFVIYFKLKDKNVQSKQSNFVFLIAKKYRTRVEKNYYKRLLREFTRLNIDLFNTNYDYAIMFRYIEKKKTYESLNKSFKYILRKMEDRLNGWTTQKKSNFIW